MDKTIVIGITGPTGAGKTTLCKILKENSYAIINADKIAKKFLSTSQTCKQKLIEHFGTDIVDVTGNLRPTILAKKAFSTQSEQVILNKITHPGIIEAIKSALEAHKLRGDKIVILDVPLLFETGLDICCNYTIAVLANEKIRCERLLKRDNIEKSLINLRMAVQNKNSYYKDRADYILENDASLDDLNKKVREIFTELLGEMNEKI